MDRTQADVTPNLDAVVAAVQSSASCLVKHEQEEPILDPQGLMAPASDDDGQDLEMDRPLRRKRRVKGQKICGVCGDHAQSHNFGALTCETCKAFFRRNAFKQKELQTCVFNSSCSITKATRRFCAPCRLKKCYSIGMDPDLILGEEEKKARLTKRDREGPSPGPNREKRHSQSSEPQSTNFRTPILSPNSTASPGSSVDSGIDVGTTAGAANSSTSQLNYPDKGKWCRPKNALGKHFKHVARDNLPWDMQLFWPLQAEERSLLTKLTSAYQSVTTSTSLEDLEKMRQWGSFCMEKAIFALEYSMREYVEFARVIPEFQQLRQGDQIAVLKASALMWYHIRLASDFIPERRSWVNAFGSMSEVDLGNFLGDPHGVQEYAEFCEGLKFVVKNDTTLYALMHTLVLFDPRDSKVEDRIMVNTLKDKYLVLLKHHLESQFSFLHADRYMAEIAQQILDLRQLGESSLIFYKHFQSQFRPLIAEVFAD